MNVIPFKPRPPGDRYDAARQRMLDEFLTWLRADPIAAEIALEEAFSTAPAMRQLAEMVKMERRHG